VFGVLNGEDEADNGVAGVDQQICPYSSEACTTIIAA
jgi:hypothetical protein